jgi:hypothetical protein
MIAESFDSRTLANMEVALERACKILSTGAEEHGARRHTSCRRTRILPSPSDSRALCGHARHGPWSTDSC